MSIEGLSTAMSTTLKESDRVPEITPDTNFIDYPGAQFGVLEAKRHRARGVNLAMFLGLMKYYRQAYLDLIEQSTAFNNPVVVSLFIRRFFDRTEVAYCTEWAGSAPEAQIKELSSANLSLTNEKNKYLTIFESLASPVLLYDEDRILDNYNNAAGRLLLGNSTSGAHYYAEKHTSMDQPVFQDEIENLMSQDENLMVVEKTLSTPEGEKTYDVKVERMLDVSRKFSGHTVLFNDITDRQQWANQLEEVNRKQEQLINDLNRTREQLVQSEKMAAIGQLAAGIAHEINTPAQYVSDNTHFLEEAFDDLVQLFNLHSKLLIAVESDHVTDDLVEALKQKVDEVDWEYLAEEIPAAISQSQVGIDRISEIVLAMKEFSHPGTKEKTDIDINRAIQSTIEVATSEWKHYANIEVDFDPSLPPVHCLPGELNQAILNIIVNAAHAISEKLDKTRTDLGTITLCTRKENDSIKITIKDTGPGIPDEIKSQIFDPFFTTKEVGKGTGQGLAIAYSVIVDKHHGTIHVESEPGSGTTFTIRLPIPTS